MSTPVTAPMGYDVITASGQLLYASTYDYAMRIQALFGGTIYHSNTTDPAPHPPPTLPPTLHHSRTPSTSPTSPPPTHTD
jgi:hypothetical protein